LKSYQRGVVLGTRSYGKGSVQTILNLNEAAGVMKLTTAFLILPNGEGIQKLPGKFDWGVDPTDGFYLPTAAKQDEAILKRFQQSAAIGAEAKEKAEDDPQLAGALKTVAAKLKDGNYEKVGQANAALRARLAELEKVQQQQAELQKKLREVNQRLDELKKATEK
jgi:hypothetical protein